MAAKAAEKITDLRASDFSEAFFVSNLLQYFSIFILTRLILSPGSTTFVIEQQNQYVMMQKKT